MFIKLFVYTLMLRTCNILPCFLCVCTHLLFYYNNYYKSVCIYASVAAVIIKIFGSQVKSSKLNYSIEYCVAIGYGPRLAAALKTLCFP